MWLLLIFLAVTDAVLILEGCKNVTVCGQLPWSDWTTCSQSCGGGSQTRKREICGLPEWNEEEVEERCRKPLRIEHRVCNAECLNGGMFVDICVCKPENSGMCCENGLSFESLTTSKEKASSFLRKRGSRRKRRSTESDDLHIEEECHEAASCSYEEVREWTSRMHDRRSVCQWMKDRRCGEKRCGSEYRCETNGDCSKYSHYQAWCTANVINCPDGVQELNFTKLTENITFSSFDHLPGIYGQSCDGERLTVNFPETELTWSREIHTITMTANDSRGHSTSCVLSVKINDMIPPSFLDCPSLTIVQYGSDGGSVVTWSPIHAEDNSGNVTVSSSNSNGEFMKFGSHLISNNATDEFGNTNQCNFTVTVKKLPKSVCNIPPQVFHGVISCHDGHTLTCGIDRCETGYLQTNATNHVCSNGIWKPQFSAEFVSLSCIKPEPTHLERNYTFRFTCPNLKFSPIALRDCIKQLGLCPTGDILLCDKPFQRIEGKHLSSKDLQIWTTLEGILPYEANKDDLINRMDDHGKSIAAYFEYGKFKQICHQLKCQFKHFKTDPIREVCGNGAVEFILHEKRICRKCGPGWFYDGGDCVQCSEGFYQDQYGQSGCKKCPDGTTSLMGTFIKSRCFVKVIVEKQTSSFNTLTIVGISISGSLLIVFIVLIVMVNKWRMSANRTNSDNNLRTEEHTHHTVFDETLSEVYDEIKEDRVFEGYINHKPGISDTDGGYESLPERQHVENPYTRMSWRNY